MKALLIGDLIISKTGYHVVKDFSVKNSLNNIEVGTIFNSAYGFPISSNPEQISIRMFLGYQPQFIYTLNNSNITLTQAYDYIKKEILKPKTIFFFSYLNHAGYYSIATVTQDSYKILPHDGKELEFELGLDLIISTQNPSVDLTGILSPTAIIGNPQQSLVDNIQSVKDMSSEGKSFAKKVKDGVVAIQHAQQKVSEAIYAGKQALDDVKNILVNIKNTVQEVENTIRDLELMYQNTVNIYEAIASGNITSLDDLINIVDLLDYQLDLSYNVTNRYSLLNLL